MTPNTRVVLIEKIYEGTESESMKYALLVDPRVKNSILFLLSCPHDIPGDPG